MHNRIQTIVIVGGGTAGWMTAAGLSSLLAPESVEIKLIESDQIGTVGVGEATIPDIKNFNQLLGINEADFMKATHATFKLGSEFINWGEQGDRYLHPFGNHGVDMNGIDFHQYWMHAHNAGSAEPIERYSMSAVAAKANRFVLPDPNPKSVTSHIRYAYHFDATLYARFLRDYAEKRGVKRIEGKVDKVTQDDQSGNIKSLRLERGETVEGDFFFDCTGFRSLLLGQTLGVDFTDWSHWLPCNSAQTVASQSSDELLPYTRSTAHAAGWQWRIPTQSRTGNGHIYSSDYMSDDEAVSILMDGLDTPAIGEPRRIQFKTGHRDKFWDKNCIAIGLSSGFLEPLESTSIYLIQQGISRFISLFPDKSLPDPIRNEYNRMMHEDFEQVRDFLILHYKATQRSDSAFWAYCKDMDIPQSLQRKIDLFKTGGRVYRYDGELFSRPSWVAVFLGQNVLPDICDPIVAALPADQVSHSIGSMNAAMSRAAQAMPSHAEFIARYCPADIG